MEEPVIFGVGSPARLAIAGFVIIT